jgi:hypothetical protein
MEVCPVSDEGEAVRERCAILSQPRTKEVFGSATITDEEMKKLASPFSAIRYYSYYFKF